MQLMHLYNKPIIQLILTNQINFKVKEFQKNYHLQNFF